MTSQEEAEDALGRLNETREGLLAEIRKGIIGQDDVIEQLLVSLLARGHRVVVSTHAYPFSSIPFRAQIQMLL